MGGVKGVGVGAVEVVEQCVLCITVMYILCLCIIVMYVYVLFLYLCVFLLGPPRKRDAASQGAILNKFKFKFFKRKKGKGGECSL